MSLEYQIHHSVGRRSKGAANQPEDVDTVQNMLRLAAMIESDPRLDPGTIDGVIDADEANDDTIKAIEAFQSRFFTPDGVINVGKRTWEELLNVLEGDDADADSDATPAAASTPPTAAGQCCFPFTELPKLNWTEDIRRFGARRSKGARAHAGCDLYYPVGTTIHAIADGTVVQNAYPFYEGTYALEIDHGAFVARYGEIQQHAMVKGGDKVVAGQPIAKVGKLNGMINSMLHLELYDKSATGPLTVKNSSTKKTAQGVPFMRRKDLMDPTPRLEEWKTKLAGG